MSANSAVTVLRSPSTVVGGSVRPAASGMSGALPEARVAEAVFVAESAAPQSPQKSSSASLSALHLGHTVPSFEPQLLQNLRPSRLSLPHFEQRIFP
jgi:hypothetical protein